MAEQTFDQEGQTVARQTNVAGDVVHGDRITVIGNHNVVGDHNVVTIINNLVQGVRRLPTDYATRIQNFLVEYLGTPEHPVPFGGRAAALAELDAWLDDAAAPPYLLLTAPAGRGKSALLARWSQTLAQRENAPAVIFLPVSVRFRTNLSSVVFASLAAQLAHLHGDEVPLTSESTEIWRGMASSYLSRPLPDGRRLLVILDGMDEATDWDVGADLFPATPPPGLRIVLAARQTAERPTEDTWRRALGWERPDLACALDLTPLDRPGVADVLKRMGVPLDVLARDVDVTAELHRLSAGDPLLVRLYVDDLWARGEAASRLRPEDLRAIQPGLAGYFDRWWADQRALWGNQTPLKEPAVQALLNLLACALGPLTAGDVLTLAADCDLNTWTLEEALRPLARFIVGDGRGQGYVFPHPKLGDYFYGRLTPAERRAWEGRFLDWGKATLEVLNAKTLPPKEAPAYLVQYYGAHLERAQAPDAAIYALVSEGWLRAWEALEGTHDGFLSDVARAWARAEVAHDLAMQVKCALCQASVAALSTNIPPKLLAPAVEHGILTPIQGLAIARKTADEQQRIQALIELTPHLPLDLQADALTVVSAIKSVRWRTKVLIRLAPNISPSLLFEAMAAELTVVSTINYGAEILTNLAPYLPSGLLTDALTIACKFAVPWWRAYALGGLAPHLSLPLLNEALRAAYAIKNKRPRAYALARIGPHLSVKQREIVLSEALSTACAIKWEPSRADSLTELAPHLSPPLLVKALTIALSIEDEQARIKVLTEIISHLPPLLLAEALTTVRAIEDKKGHIQMLLATHAIDTVADETAQAITPLTQEQILELMYQILDVPIINNLKLKEITEVLSELTLQLQPDLLAKVLTDVRAIEDKLHCIYAMTAIAPYLPNEQLLLILSEAYAIANLIDDSDECIKAQIGLAPYLLPELLPEMLVITRSIEDTYHRTEVLSRLCLCLSPEQRKPLLSEALVVVSTIEDEMLRAHALRELIPQLPPALFPMVMTILTSIEDEQCRTYVLTGKHLLLSSAQLFPEWQFTEAPRGFAQYLPFDLLPEALIIATALENEQLCIDALCELTPFLPPRLLSKALTAACAIRDKYDRARALTAISLHLPLDLHTQALVAALEAATAIEEEWDRAQALAAIAPHLPLDLLPPALDAARVIEIERYRAKAIAALTPHLSPDLLPLALDVARAIEDKESRVEALTAFAPYLPPDLHMQVLTEILDAIDESWYKEDRAKAFVTLAPLFSPNLLPLALNAARTIWSTESRIEVLVALAPHLSSKQREANLSRILLAASTISDSWRRGKVFAHLSCYLVAWAERHSEQARLTACAVLHLLAARTRREFLRDLEALTPFFIALVPEASRQQVAADIFHAIQDVSTWWP